MFFCCNKCHANSCGSMCMVCVFSRNTNSFIWYWFLQKFAAYDLKGILITEDSKVYWFLALVFLNFKKIYCIHTWTLVNHFLPLSYLNKSKIIERVVMSNKTRRHYIANGDNLIWLENSKWDQHLNLAPVQWPGYPLWISDLPHKFSCIWYVLHKCCKHFTILCNIT